MVSGCDDMLDQVFHALADPTRRAIIARLHGSEGLTVGVLAEPFALSLPAAIKHIDVLCDAGLVHRTRTGRTVTCRLSPEAMSDAMAWLERHARFWEAGLDRLEVLVDGPQTQGRKSDDDQERSRRRARRQS